MPGFPAATEIHDFDRGDEEHERPVDPELAPLGLGKLRGILGRPEYCVPFVIASQHQRSLKNVREAVKDALGTVLGDDEVSNIMGSKDFPSGKLLRHAGIRFDLVLALTMRSVFQWIFRYEGFPIFATFCDGSPSSGYEAFVAVEHCVGTVRWWNRLLPLNFLARGFQSLTAKVFSILWKILLVTGPHESAFRQRLRAIRCFCTDGGTEASIADTRDVLGEFLDFVGCDLVVEKQEYLFPLAIFMSGWHHRWDNILKETLESLTFWNQWLASGMRKR